MSFYVNGSFSKTSTFFRECNSVFGASPGNAVFTKVTMSAATAAEKQAYANWYSYYRTRMLAMKSAVGLAFKPLDDQYRVGFTRIGDTGVTGTSFVNVSDFDVAQKGVFYSTLYGATPSGYTPLRGALSKAGQYFAKKASGQIYDPVQYSCQKNFTMLSTDGYWNTDHETSSYGPYKLDGTTLVGQQDSTAARPMFDGTITTRKEITPHTVVRHQRSVYLRTTSTTWTRDDYSLGGVGQHNCNNPKRRVRKQEQRRNETQVDTVTNLQDNTGTYTRTVTFINGVQASDVNSSTSWSPSWSTTSSTTAPGSPTWTTWGNFGSAGNETSCLPNPTMPSPDPSNPTISSGPTPTNGTASNTLLSTDAPIAGSTTSSSTSSGGVSDSLADIAMYYYTTDLRAASLGNCSSPDVCENNVRAKGTDTATWQHMTTYTLGLGVNGTLQYQPDYGSSAVTSGDFYSIVQGTKNWPTPGDSKEGENVDDLWHAAVNGRGRYFSAASPTELETGLSNTLNEISAQEGAGAAAATSTLRPVAGNNYVFVGKYHTQSWHGDLERWTVNPGTGALTKTTLSALAQLNARIAAGTARNVYYFRPGTGNTGSLRSFTYANLSGDGRGGDFDNACGKSPALSQCAGFNAAQTASANSGASMVDFFLGASNPVYRDRPQKLGDLGNAAPAYVGETVFNYTENNYAAYRSAQANRTGVVYVASNDGMLHAFDAATLEEKWAYVPTGVMPKLYRLADNNYADAHQYYVDGSPTVGDIYVGGAWKTILVGGLGAGGRGYYALDITNPNSPLALWEFTDTDLGLTYGNPIITKRANGTWVVVFASGHNNNVSGGDGNGHLYVLDANTGQQQKKLGTFVAGGTPAGTATTPSGLAEINSWVDADVDNTSKRFYGGDLRGNVWRFDIDSLVQPFDAALQLAKLTVGSAAQPITTQPMLAELRYGGADHAVVYLATGRYLGVSDLANTDQQTIYALKDSLSATGLGDVRSAGNLVAKSLDLHDATLHQDRTIAPSLVNWSSADGWKLDLPSSGERVNVDMQLQLSVLSASANIPKSDACTTGGESWLYQLDLSTGGAVPGAAGGAAGRFLGTATTVGLTSVQLENGDQMTIITNARGELSTSRISSSVTLGPARRTSWRELAQ